MQLLSAYFLMALASGCLIARDTTGDVISPSCMTHQLHKAGFHHSNATRFEQRMIASEMTVKDIIDAPTNLLRFLLRPAHYDDARKIQNCIAKTSNGCEQYEPCHNGGDCQLNSDKNGYVCVCHAHFTGNFCKTPHPAPIGELRALQKQFEMFRETVAEDRNSTIEKLKVAEQKQKVTDQRLKVAEGKLTFHGSGCSSSSLGYQYHAHRRMTIQKSGTIDTMTFRKKYASTVLKLTYSGNIRLAKTGHTVLGKWFFMIDGRECSKPNNIDISLYNNNGDNDHVPSVLYGICEGTDAGPIGKGDHTITVHIGSLGGNVGDVLLGWRSTSIMEVQEMCPPF